MHTRRGSLFPMTTSHTPKKRPPPVAPKPTHHSTHTTSADTAYQLLEDPSSFLDVSVCVCVCSFLNCCIECAYSTQYNLSELGVLCFVLIESVCVVSIAVYIHMSVYVFYLGGI